MNNKNIGIIGAKNNREALERKDHLISKYGFRDITANHRDIEGVELVVAIGGDGLMLHLLHEFEKNPLPIYGINCGTVGFLMNSLHEQDLPTAIKNAEESIIHPLRMNVTDMAGKKHSHLAINEVALLRQSSQAAKIKIVVNGRTRIESLSADGVLVSTAAGSTAYNLSAGGPIIPFGSEILALTPISPFRPRSWRGALLPTNSKVVFEVMNPETRPTSATADSSEVRDVKFVEVFEDRSIEFKILFDPNHSLEERIIREQFVN